MKPLHNPFPWKVQNFPSGDALVDAKGELVVTFNDENVGAISTLSHLATAIGYERCCTLASNPALLTLVAAQAVMLLDVMKSLKVDLRR